MISISVFLYVPILSIVPAFNRFDLIDTIILIEFFMKMYQFNIETFKKSNLSFYGKLFSNQIVQYW